MSTLQDSIIYAITSGGDLIQTTGSLPSGASTLTKLQYDALVAQLRAAQSPFTNSGSGGSTSPSINGQLNVIDTGLHGAVIKSAANGIGLFSHGTQIDLQSSVFTGGLGFQVGANGTGVIQAYTPSAENGTLLLNPMGGSIGIGTSSPSSSLHIKGDAAGGSNISAGFITLHNGAGNIGDTTGIAFKNSWEQPAIKTAIVAAFNGNWSMADLRFCLNNSGNTSNVDPVVDTKVIIKNSGFVGIGTTSPQRLLDVNGALRVAGTIYDSTAVGARMVRTSSQSVPSSTEIAIAWDSAISDTDNSWSSANPTRIYAQRSGYRRSTFTWGLTNANNTISAPITARIRKNGSTYVGTNSGLTAANKYWLLPVEADMFWMNAGDYIECIAYHEQGATRNTWASYGADECACVATLTRIS